MKGKENQNGIFGYWLSDYFSSLFAWAVFFILRKIFIDQYPAELFPQYLDDDKFFIGLLIIPFGWLLLYYVTGTYTSIYLKSRVGEITKTFFVTLAGVVILFFTVLIDDQVLSYRDYYESIAILLVVHFLLTITGRLTLLNAAKHRLQAGLVYFPTLFIGGNKRAKDVYSEINGKGKSQGYKIVGYIDTNGEGNNNGYGEHNGNGNGLNTYAPKLGRMTDLGDVIQAHHVKQCIVAIESSEHHQLKEILNQLADRNVIIKIVPDMYDILSGSVRMNHLLGTSFIEIYPQLMAKWQYIAKRIFDIVISSLVLILFSPLYLYVAIRVKLSSKGPILYLQQRTGLHGKQFTIYKFRSMYEDAELSGPQLSSIEDARITPWGRFMRKWRLDEFPQFYNVLKGEMSIVGPRPERDFYIQQILNITTDYKHLHRVQPGITSLGMVKFGYAENLQQMIQRVKYDLLYIENMSLLLDLKILLYTFRTIIQGRGK